MKSRRKSYILGALSLLAPTALWGMAIKSDGSLLVYDEAREKQSPQFQEWLREHPQVQNTPEYRQARLLEQVKTQSLEYQTWFRNYQRAKQNNSLHTPIRIPVCTPTPEISPAAWQEIIKKIRAIR
ncbi:hypothetical protein CVU75_03725 [Candidatus Dependentiae bacterium HGW-Dependentiae-1]|nr:MAG: hypothetical protein CVU75_03725 [Candidatus Dependentiae bacterium HGW-Dependentiae-1]